MTVLELTDEFEREYRSLADFLGRLSEEQLDRKAHIPMLRETDIGEYPTLGQWAYALGEWHLGFHLDHLKEVLRETSPTGATEPK